MSIMKPKISCVMPTKNRESLIGESIKSIIDQSMKEWELIIVDDHSDENDKTQRIIKSFADDRIKYVKLNNNGSGVASARNLGNILAQADLIAVMDSDDISYPYRFDLTIKEFKKKACDVVYGEIDWWEPENNKIWTRKSKWRSRDYNLKELIRLDYIPNVTSAYKKRVAVDFPYNSFFRRAEDWDYFLRVGRYGYKFSFIPKSLTKVRRHKNSIIEQDFIEYDYDKIVSLNNKK